ILDTIFSSLLSGAGYFVRNKQYETIAEAQAPPFSNLALSFGVITFWLSFVGVAWAAIQLPKFMKANFIFILLWTAASIYMAVSAARFMFNAGPAFAITSGWIIAIILEKLTIKKFLDQLKRTSVGRLSRKYIYTMAGSVALLILVAVGMSTVSDIAIPIFVIGMVAIAGYYILTIILETNPNRLYNLLTVMLPLGCAFFYLYAGLVSDWELTNATHGFVLMLILFIYLVIFLTVRKTKLTFTAGIFFFVFFIIVPNVWAGLDAGIPYETKQSHDKEIYQAMPIFIQPPNYDEINGTNWYLGGFGYSLPLNSRYWPAGYDWLATQDTEVYPWGERPAFLSWWDYGFEVVNEGHHPTVADNFLGGHQLAGNFIMSQSEEDAIALLCARIIEGDYDKWIQSGEERRMNNGVRKTLEEHDIDVEMILDILENPSDYIDIIKANPELYGPRDEIIQPANAKYMAIRGQVTTKLDIDGVVSLYHELRLATGSSIRYFGIDSRLFPFSAENTGIFYAPAKLSDHRIDEIGNQPYDFWEIKAVGEFGGEYSLDEIPPDVNLDPDNPYKIAYKEMFYNSMLYRCFIGYSGMDVDRGEDAGIPGLSGSMQQDPIMPGWNMSHFKLVHRTAYWNPYSAEDVPDNPDAWRAMNYWDAYNKQQDGDGVADLSDRSSVYQGVMMLKYYDGAIVHGTVMLEDGTPVSGAKVTVLDDLSIPHQMVITDEDGSYSILAPFGDIIIVVSAGEINPMNLVGGELNVTQMFIEDYQAMRVEEDRDNNGIPDYLVDLDPVISSGSLTGTVFWDENGDEVFNANENSIQNAEVRLSNLNLDFSINIFTNSSGMFNVDNIAPGEYDAKVYIANRSFESSAATVISGEDNTKDIGIRPTSLSGRVSYSNGDHAEGVGVNIWIPGEDLYMNTQAGTNGSYMFN
ncbi:MAG: hypothetical protein KAX31_03370, partial [Thermoplasmata archaeon]|nr:hypothetical protein [Thermoplasmata archaeon]